MTSLSTPFSLETVSATRSISLLISLPHPETLQSEHASVECWNQVCLVYLVEQYGYRLAFHLKSQRIVPGFGQRACKIAAAADGHLQAHLNVFSHVVGDLLETEKRPVHARRGNFQMVFTLDWIFHIQHATDLMRDSFTIFDSDAILGIDVQPQYGMLALRQEFNAPELHPHRMYGRLQQLFQHFNPFG